MKIMFFSLNNLKNRMGLDVSTSYSIAIKVILSFGGLINIYLISRYFSKEMQGFYYTFSSLIALQALVELGLNNAVLQFISHEMSKLRWNKFSIIIGNQKAKKRVQSLFFFSLRWFLVASLILTTVLIFLGLHFFSAYTSNDIDFKYPWIFLVCSVSFMLLVNSLLVVLEGCNKVLSTLKIRFYQSLISTSVSCISIINGLKLYSLCAALLAANLIGVVLLWVYHKRFFIDLLNFKSSLSGVNWKNEVFPFQSKVALSWFSGILMFQLFTPIVFAKMGPEAAGKVGVSLQIIMTLNLLSLSWLSTKSSLFSRYVALSQRSKLDYLYDRSFIQSSVFHLTFLLLSIIGLTLMKNYSPVLYERVLPINFFSILCIASFGNHFLFSQAVYLRAHKKELLMGISVFSAFTTLVLAFVLTGYWGLVGTVFSFAIPSIFINFLLGNYVFNKFRKSVKNEK
jgi:O-antigen/teichoic acid export membrane protein